ncbi:dTMP kinase [Limisalsivibrio acetivorans]|uniref:dTMP kinase n=1 Tax=Limisalsivibrio acetivorans TaxID=1304888 RepID=UPI0024BEAA05|nr:dTMP kinase [Limisalsivibrio acetivorans]
MALDGLDGCGKSTQCLRLAKYYADKGREILLTREPGGTDLGAELRERLLSKRYELEIESELMLFFVDRVEHLAKVVVPALNEGKVVISDRFTASTFAYQVHGRGIGRDAYDALEAISLRRVPDLAVIVDADPQVCVGRAVERLRATGTEEAEGKFEMLGSGFFQKVRRGFLDFADEHSFCEVVNGSGSEDDVFKRILEHLQ